MTSSGEAKQNLLEWVSIAADVGVLLGLILVIIQLRQNAALDRAHTRHELATGVVELLDATAANAQLASVLRRGSVGEPLTPDEQYQFRVRSNALLRMWEDVHYQYRQGLYDQNEFDSHRSAWRDTLAHSIGFNLYWCEVRPLYTPQFAAEMNVLLQRPCPPTIARQPG